MASSETKKSTTWKNHRQDTRFNQTTDTNLALGEERRLLHPEQHRTKKPVANERSEKRIGKFNYFVNQMTSAQVDEELEKRQLPISGNIDIRRTRLKHCHSSEFKYGSKYPLNMVEQDFDYIAVVDFEATCEDNRPNNFPHEIIEFPIVLINVQERTIIDKFQSYCRPTIKPILSKFCTELTGIEQHQVENAPIFVEVLHNVETWLKERNLLSSTNKRSLAFATDGPWDFANFLQMQCRFSSIPYPKWADKWINIRKHYSNFYGVRRCGIDKMLTQLGLSFDGHRHSGLDDSINIARIAIELLKDGCVLFLNDGIRKNDSKDEVENSIVFRE